MMTRAALPYPVFDQTGSSLDVGLLGLAQPTPLVVFAVVGVFAERAGEAPLAPGIDRRLAVLFGGAWGERVVLHPRLWVVFVLGAAWSGITAMTMPVLRSVLPLLLEESRRPAAFALHAAYGSLG
jgi:hypothetical protein